MSIFEDLAEMKRLADYISEEITPLVKYRDDAPRKDISKWLRYSIICEKIVLRSSQGSRTEISAKIKDGELFPTSFPSIMATNKEDRDKFEYYINCGRIMDCNKVAVRKGYYTQYAVDKAVRFGELEKIDEFGSAITLYVD